MTNSNSQPVISVIMPMYNAERYILKAIASILQERRLSLELIVVDDGSTDKSFRRVSQLKDSRLHLLRNEGKGIAHALNTGLSVASGQVIARCDADDLYPAHRLVNQVEWLMQHPEFAAVCGNYSAIDAKGSTVIRFSCGATDEEVTEELQQGNTRTHLGTFAIRAEALRNLGGFRPYFTTGEDIDFQLRLGERYRVWYQSHDTYHYRLHHTSITHTKSSTEREFFDFVAREFQKQRYATGSDDIERGQPPKLPERFDKKALDASRHIQGFLLGQAWLEFQAGKRRQALLTGLRSVFAFPQNLAVWRSLVSLLIKSISYKSLPHSEQALMFSQD